MSAFEIQLFVSAGLVFRIRLMSCVMARAIDWLEIVRFSIRFFIAIFLFIVPCGGGSEFGNSVFFVGMTKESRLQKRLQIENETTRGEKAEGYT